MHTMNIVLARGLPSLRTTGPSDLCRLARDDASRYPATLPPVIAFATPVVPGNEMSSRFVARTAR